MDKKTKQRIEKVKAILNDRSTTTGEKAAAFEAIKRLDPNAKPEAYGLGIQTCDCDIVDLDAMVWLWPTAMVWPTTECIYAPAKLCQGKQVRFGDLGKPTGPEMWISRHPDGHSDACREMTYGRWIVIDHPPC